MSDDETTLKQIVVSRPVVQLSAAAFLIVFSLITSFAVGFFVKESHRLRAEQLQVKNELLMAEVEEIRAGYAELREAVEELSKRDEHYRLLAGLEPLSLDVMRAGIGGPGTATLQSNELWKVDPEIGSITFAAAYDLNELVRRARVLAASWSEASDSLASSLDRLRSTPSILPTKGYVSSRYSSSRLHPLLDTERAHTGVDFSAPQGTPIVATADGRVISVGRRGNYGLMIEIDHGHGFVSRYAHASRALVRQGQWVKRGEEIGEVGKTGLAAGPHLHYEVLVNGRYVNPLDYILDSEIRR